MLYNEIIGHDHLISMLKNALKYNRVAHAYLFHGHFGIGKKTVATAFAQALVCTEPQGGAACGCCFACKKAAGGNHPDIHFIEPTSPSLKLEQVRNLQKEVMLKPYEGKKKVFIISQAETLTGQAANSLLKTLEEPPEDTVFILVAVNAYTLLPTILSRCQQITFNKIPLNPMQEMIINKFNKKPEEAGFLASLADGIVGRAIQLADSGEILQQRDYAIKLAKLAREGNYFEFYQAAEELENNKDDIMTILDFMAAWYRDIIVWQETGNERLLVNLDKKEGIIKQKKYPAKLLIEIIRIIENTKYKISAKVNFRLAVEVLLISINHA